MADSWPKIIRDPVHNVVSFDNTLGDRLLLDLINCREFQRLRRIKQLGVSDLVFPGATHTRFAHSIGVMHITRKFLRQFRQLDLLRLEPHQETIILCAALLHDIGHGPFSHAFEKITKDNHEKRTLQVIRDTETEVHRRLAAFDAQFPDQLVMFFDEDGEPANGKAPIIPLFLTDLISSQLDADRFDYLLRDSLCTGTDYGRFDLEWIIHHTLVDERKGHIYLNHKGLFAAEAYVFARHHMYRTVYFHKATRAAEVMLQLIFKRFKELIDNQGKETVVQKIVPGVPTSLTNAFIEDLSLANYLEIDEATALEFFHACSRSGDTLLAQLGGGLLSRVLYKAIDLSPDLSSLSPYQQAEFFGKALDLLQKKGLNRDYNLIADTPSDTPYKPYDPDAEQQAVQIRVANTQGIVQEISKLSEPIKELQKKYQLLRYYFPSSMRDDINGLVDEMLKTKGR